MAVIIVNFFEAVDILGILFSVGGFDQPPFTDLLSADFGISKAYLRIFLKNF
jgi:hypothetical protein